MNHRTARFTATAITTAILAVALLTGSLAGTLAGLSLNRDAAAAVTTPVASCWTTCANLDQAGGLGNTRATWDSVPTSPGTVGHAHTD